MTNARKIPGPTDFDLRLLRVFEAVVRAGSFTAAELVLNKSKSSISMDISALEGRLGLKLCRRGRGGFSLTSQGEEIHALAMDLFQDLNDFRDRVGKVASRVGGELNTVMDDDFPVVAQIPLLEALRNFNSAHPEVFLTIRTTSPEHVVQLVLDGTAQVGISAVPRNVPEVELSPLFSELMVLLCGARHPLFSRPDAEIDLGVVANYDCVDVAARQSARASSVMDKLRIRARAGTVQSRVLFLLSGNFLGFLPLEFADNWIVRGEMRPLLVNELSYQNICYGVTRRGAMPNAARERFVAELKRVFERQPAISSKLSAGLQQYPELRIGAAPKNSAGVLKTKPAIRTRLR
jgi:LysR family transcriptional regulator, transcriptional activator for bauABCD operon